MVRLKISLSDEEAEALAKLAYSELRDPHDQIRWLIRRELESQGLLPSSSLRDKQETDSE